MNIPVTKAKDFSLTVEKKDVCTQFDWTTGKDRKKRERQRTRERKKRRKEERGT
jgi:hypothetical protein